MDAVAVVRRQEAEEGGEGGAPLRVLHVVARPVCRAVEHVETHTVPVTVGITHPLTQGVTFEFGVEISLGRDVQRPLKFKLKSSQKGLLLAGDGKQEMANGLDSKEIAKFESGVTFLAIAELALALWKTRYGG